MSTDNTSKTNTVAIWGLIFTALSILIGIYYNNRQKEREEQKLKIEEDDKNTKKRKDSLELLEKIDMRKSAYQNKVNEFERKNKALLKDNWHTIPLRFITNSTDRIRICIYYYSISEDWVTTGHLPLSIDEPLNFFNQTNNRKVFISIESDAGLLLNRNIKINSSDPSGLHKFIQKIKYREGFLILDKYDPPYETINRTFYEINIPPNNIIAIDLSPQNKLTRFVREHI